MRDNGARRRPNRVESDSIESGFRLDFRPETTLSNGALEVLRDF